MMENKKINNIKRISSLNIKKGVSKMDDRSTNRLLALTDTTCEFILAFFKKIGKIDEKTLLTKHIKINKDVFESKIDLLKKAELINNCTKGDMRTFSLTSEGENAISSLGY